MAERKFTYDRFFGDNIESSIKNKLNARQRLQKGGEFGESNDAYHAGTPYTENGQPSGPDLSQRMPWARMWTAVETYELSPTHEKLVELAGLIEENTDVVIYEDDIYSIDGKWLHELLKKYK